MLRFDKEVVGEFTDYNVIHPQRGMIALIREKFDMYDLQAIYSLSSVEVREIADFMDKLNEEY